MTYTQYTLIQGRKEHRLLQRLAEGMDMMLKIEFIPKSHQEYKTGGFDHGIYTGD